MNALNTIAEDYSPEEVANAVYFAIRYVKQVSIAHRSGKEIFQDATRSAPGEKVQNLTMALIGELEKQLGHLVSHFGAEQFRQAVDALTALAQSRRGTISDEDRAVAEALAEELAVSPLQTHLI
jgi:hypothetical protein